MQIVRETNLPLKLYKRGKVRDIYELDNERLLIVATDRISAFDWVMGEGIPEKGKVLNCLSCFWFSYFKEWSTFWEIPHHFLSDDVYELGLPQHIIEAEDLVGRCMIVKKADAPIPVECIMRGYLYGSAWKEYQDSGTVCGLSLPKNLKQGERLPKPIFTVSTKAEQGHDRNLTTEETIEFLAEWTWPGAEEKLGMEAAKELFKLLEIASGVLYFMGRVYANAHGVILADTKLEFGIKENEVILIDEVLTPDSSRFWNKDAYKVGKDPENFDKQFLRDWLETTGWDKSSTPPALSQEVIEATSRRYQEILRRLTSTLIDQASKNHKTKKRKNRKTKTPPS